MQTLSAITPRYDAFLLDLWGVVHDGSHLYPGVKDVLVQLKKDGKKVAFISNAPRRAHKVIHVLGELGIERELYDFAVSSGEIGYRWLENQPARKYYYIGPSKDADILDGLDYTRTDDIKLADFLLNVGFGSEEQSAEDFGMLFRAAKAQNLPMLCLNPDMEVVKQTGERFACAGVLAKAYERLGGDVTWFGKPYASIYDYCMTQFPGIPKSRILAVGDSLETDIPGALSFGVDAMLITGGILKHHSPAEIETMCRTLNLVPHYVLPSLG